MCLESQHPEKSTYVLSDRGPNTDTDKYTGNCNFAAAVAIFKIPFCREKYREQSQISKAFTSKFFLHC